jgi:hypothetical protein
MVEEPTKIYETCTIFDLKDREEENIKKDRLTRAKMYWRLEKKYKEKLSKE